MNKFPAAFSIKLTEQDKERLNRISEKTEIPSSTLVRRVIRQWLKSVEAEFQNQNPPAA
jgi:predicted DNA-binding protein